jgi:hypothetical protein
MADTKVSALTQVATLEGEDQVYLVETDAGPGSAKATIDQIRNLITPRGYIFGLKLSNNGTDAANDLDIDVGEAMAESHDQVMTLAGAITKQIDATWAVGTNQGGMNTGSVANDTWYEVHLIKRLDTGVVDVMFTTTANRATLPANYTKQRRIGWVRRGTATILAFTQVEDHFTLTNSINEVTAPNTTAQTVTLTVPPNTIALFRAGTTGTTSGTAGSAVFHEIVEATAAPDAAVGMASIGYADAAVHAGGHFALRVNASSQFRHDSTTTTGVTLDTSTYGWIDHRRRLDAV